MKKVFNPHAWLEANNKRPTVKYKPPTATVVGDSLANVEQLVSRIESCSIDITQGYENWRNIGFSLSESLGETGRNYFHRISRLNPGYNRERCDKQYTNCLKCRGGGITLATLFWIAKTHGVLIKNRI
ncbi:PriCT-2 domain-containing protein [Labilibaculum sp. K2S]|uniref:PriCT-2 domain-containing protein n=1 Tax=Labilibaculum sp. K2S TaxID=3056386 RepID=UPI0025A4A143|nr:PriCT-2 domain-containing protein [Labilibaculum sp. K2S]MDM8161423.1 PriCT-2 domain-containing protein [Labilibaculum sp. K2S]